MNPMLSKQNILILSTIIFLTAWAVDSFGGYSYVITEPLVNYALALFVSTVLMVFSKNEVFLSWIWMLAWWTPSSLYLIWMTKMGGMFSPGSEGMSRISGEILFLMSLVIFSVKSWELRRNDSGKPLAWWVKWGILVLGFVASVIASIYIYEFVW